MNIWFDLSNSPHINLFAEMIGEFERDGHEVTITCRPLANTVDLLDLHGMRYEIVGEHYGAKFLRKVFGYPIRVYQLLRYLRPRHIDVAISQSSFHSPVVGRLLGIPTVYMNDNEHALGNVPAFLAASRILVPEYFSAKNLDRQLANPKKVRRYPGVKEGIYLSRLHASLEASRRALPAKQRKKVYIRPEPWTAQYYRGDKNFLDHVILGIKDQADVVVLPRGSAQGKHYRDGKFAGVVVVDTAIDLMRIAPDCDLFIGAGGTMTREMAVLGIPTISVYQDELLDVDRHLLDIGAFMHLPRLRPSEVLAILRDAQPRQPDGTLLEKGRQAYQQIRDEVLTVERNSAR